LQCAAVCVAVCCSVVPRVLQRDALITKSRRDSCMSTQIYTYMYMYNIYTYICIYTYMYTLMCVDIYVYVYLYTLVQQWHRDFVHCGTPIHLHNVVHPYMCTVVGLVHLDAGDTSSLICGPTSYVCISYWSHMYIILVPHHVHTCTYRSHITCTYIYTGPTSTQWLRALWATLLAE